MSAKLYYKNESYGRIIAEEGVLAENTEALLDFAKRYNFKNDNDFLTFIVDEEITLANNKTIPLHGYQGKLTVTKNNQDTITLENLWVEATPTFRRASREARIPLFFEYGNLMQYRFSRGKAAFNDILHDMADTFKTDAVSVTANDFTLEGYSDSKYKITYWENENNLSVLYDIDANVCGLIYNRYSLHPNVAEQDYTYSLTHLERKSDAKEIENLVNQMLNTVYENKANPVLFDVLVHTVVTYIKENQLNIQTSITKIPPRNRPYFAIGSSYGKTGTYSVPLKSHYAMKWKEELETGKKAEKPTRESFMDGKFAIHVKDYKQYLLLILYLNNTGFSTPTYPKFRYSYREDYPYFWIKYGEHSKYLTSDATAAQLPVVEFEDFAPVKEFFSIEPINKESEIVEKQNKPALMDTDTLITALYDRFHEDGQQNNITMVPLGEVIQFIKDMPVVSKESVAESENELEQDDDFER